MEEPFWERGRETIRGVGNFVIRTVWEGGLDLVFFLPCGGGGWDGMHGAMCVCCAWVFDSRPGSR